MFLCIPCPYCFHAFVSWICETGEALDCLVSIQSRSGKDDSELLELLKRVLRIQEKAFGHEGEEVMETLKKIVHYMDKMGMNNEKRPLQRRLSILRNKHKKMVRYWQQWLIELDISCFLAMERILDPWLFWCHEQWWKVLWQE